VHYISDKSLVISLICCTLWALSAVTFISLGLCRNKFCLSLHT